MSFIQFSPQFGGVPKGVRLEKMIQSKHFENGRFINLITTEMDMSLSKIPGLMYEFMFNGNGRTPAKPLPVRFDASRSEYPDSAAKITWYGHSALLLEIDNKKILLDPMLGKAASPVAFMTNRFAYEQPIDLEAIPKIDAVIYSHDHYDHLDYSSVNALKEKTEHFYTPLGVGAHLESWGVPADKITELDWWESADVGNTKLIAAPARHFSGRGLTDRNKTQWASWIIDGENEKIYFSGDSGYGPHFKEIGERFGPFDFAMMECGQYNERWEAIHMMPEQTIQASIDIKSKKMMPIHWSAFNLSLHNWTEPVERALKAAREKNVNMITPQIGLRFCPQTSKEQLHWWRDF
jgi:L-ascorbate metabolism protein UlaG (beta-lactamase superfamily)